LYAKEGHVAPVKTLEKWKWMLKQELMTITRSGAEEKSSTSSKYFAYQCGGKSSRATPGDNKD
jgi:hypothetical protein